MSTNQVNVRIIKELDQLRKVDIHKVMQALPYEDTLKMNELITALQEQNRLSLQAKTRTLEAEFAERTAQMLAQNEHLLECWEQKQQQAYSQLQTNLKQVALKISEIFNFNEQKVDFIVKQLLFILQAEDLNDATKARERHLTISLALQDYNNLKDRLNALNVTDDSLVHSWIKECLKVNNTLQDGMAIIEDDCISVSISFAEATNRCTALITNLLSGQQITSQ